MTTTTQRGFAGVYALDSSEAARAHYDDWAKDYEADVTSKAYITPKRCAEALARFVTDPKAPIADFGCGTGLSGVALTAAGFSTIDGFDLSDEMLALAEQKKAYRSLAPLDLSGALPFADESFANAAAIGVIAPELMPMTVIDEMLRVLPSGGCLVFSANDHAAADGRIAGRIMELTDCGYAELLFSEYGEHLPELELQSTVTVLRRR